MKVSCIVNYGLNGVLFEMQLIKKQMFGVKIWIGGFCIAFLSSPVPPPVITITGTPTYSDLLAAPQPSLTCSIHIPQLVESLPINVSAQWSKDGSLLTSNSRVTVREDPVRVRALLYQSTVVFSSLDGARDSGEYTCTGRVNSSDPASSAFTVALHSK